MTIKRTIAGSRLHEASDMGDIDENDIKHGSSQLLGVLDLRQFGLHVNIASSNQPLSQGGARIQ